MKMHSDETKNAERFYNWQTDPK